MKRDILVDGEWVDVGSGDQHDFEVNSEGSYTITGLPVGDYVLNESKAPDGYLILNSAIEFAVHIENDVTKITVTNEENVSAEGNTLTVTNTPGYELPATGGTGTADLIATGLLLAEASFFLMLLWRSFRKSKGKCYIYRGDFKCLGKWI